MASKSVQRRVSIYVNDKEVKNSLGGVERAMSAVRGQLRNLDQDSDDYDKKSKELKETLDQLKEGNKNLEKKFMVPKKF